MANLVALRSAIRASRATLTASRAARRSTAAGVSASDFARAARSSWSFLALAAARRRSAKLVFLGPFISILYAQVKAVPKGWGGTSNQEAATSQEKTSLIYAGA